MFADEFSSGLDDLPIECNKSIVRDKNGTKNDKKPQNKWNKDTANRHSDKSEYRPSIFRKNPVHPLIKLGKNVEPINEQLFSTETFKNFKNLHPHMIANLEQTLHVTTVTEVQRQAIPVIQSGKDALIRSQTGSGKTLAYAIPIIESLHNIRPKLTRKDGLRALIVLPTRELALQTYECFIKLVKPYTWIVPGILTGGEKRKSEKARLRKGITVLMATPGRLLDHALNTKSVSFTSVGTVIIDEADRLLDLGYEKDITTLIQILNEQGRGDRQTLLLSATLTPAVERLAGLSLRNPAHIDISSEDASYMEETLVIPSSLVQHYVVTPAKLRLVTLAALLLQKCSENESKALVFMGTQAMVDFHTELLQTVLSTINFYRLHGNMTQVERTHVFKNFRASSKGVLLCSDVAARGLDLPQVDWIVQYTAPTTANDYVHRVGRTARVGQSGNAVVFLVPHEMEFINKLRHRAIRIYELKMEDILTSLISLSFEEVKVEGIESAASTLQHRMETALLDQEELKKLGCEAYVSWARFYATYPKESRDIFNFKAIHLGHFAKSFALRDPPKVISGLGKPAHLKWKNDKSDRRSRFDDSRARGVRKKSSNLNGEFEDGLKPRKIKRKENGDE